MKIYKKMIVMPLNENGNHQPVRYHNNYTFYVK